MFLVHASRQARHDVVKDFFEKMSEGLHDRKEWKDWFGKLEAPSTVLYAWCIEVVNHLNSIK